MSIIIISLFYPSIITISLFYPMTSFKQSIAWTAVLLYHRLKIAALTCNRHTLRSTIFHTEIIVKIATFFRTTLEYICKIVGVNGRNTKRIYNRALTDSRFYEIEFYLCTKADKNILNSNVSTSSTDTSQLPSNPKGCSIASSSKFDCSSTSIIPSSRNDTIVGNSTSVHMVNSQSMSKINHTQYFTSNTSHNIQFKAVVYNNHDDVTFRGTDYLKNNTPITINTILDINRRSSTRVAIKQSLHLYKQLINLPKYQELILIMNHLIPNDIPYVPFSKMKNNICTHRRHYLAERKRTKPFFNTACVSNDVRHLHHLHDPHVPGVYGPHNDKVVHDNTLPAINKAFVHNPIHPLLASSNNGIDLIFIPTIFSACDSWQHCLTEEEVVVIKDLKIACNDLDLLLDFQLSEIFTIRTAIDALSQIEKEYHHDVLHLRYSYHTISVCAEIHNFTSNIKKKIVKKGIVIQQGIVKMVRSVLIKNSPKEAFSKLIVPLTKIAEFYLLHLPEGLFEHKLSDAGSFFDCECSYLSLNIYFDNNSWNGCPQLFYSKSQKKWFPITNSHHGLYLHTDNNNWSFGVILIFGCNINGFDQRYVTYALRLPCPGWSLVLGDYRHLLHAVSSGTAGLRFSLVVSNHGSAVRGIDECGKRVLLRNKDTYNLALRI